MKNDYLIVSTRILPECYEKVLETRRLLESGAAKDVSAAVKQTGISRSTYYKYKDDIFSPDAGGVIRKAVLSLLLTHEVGVLSAVLGELSTAGASVLTISQSLPIRGSASVMLTLDIARLTCTIEQAIGRLRAVEGVDAATLMTVE